MKLFYKAADAVRNNRVVAAVMLALTAAPSFAQTGGTSIDTSSVTSMISGDGVAALAAIGAAWLAFRYLKKVWNRI